jgi:peptide/nickel transport system substrate-binding protein
MLRPALVVLAAAILIAPPTDPLAAQATGSIVIVSGQFPSQPVPTLSRGAADNDIADLLFLRLVRLGPTLTTAGDAGFVPQLARSWSRRDSLTLVLELDPRARWHDGVAVTAKDVAWSFTRAKDPAVAPAHATALRWLTSVTAEGEHRVVLRFAKAYPTQLFDGGWQLPVLPAHLLDTIPPAQLSTSGFLRSPVGNGPYRFVRSVPGQLVELAAVSGHFLGGPKLTRVIYRASSDGDTRINLLLSGEGDGLEQLSLRSLQERFGASTDFRLVSVPSFQVQYALFNQRSPSDRTAPHPILAEAKVRQALVLALDRATAAKALYGDAATVPVGPASMALWTRTPPSTTAGGDSARAAALLAEAGWRDSDGDGVRDQGGRPLALSMIFPGTSPARRLAAQLLQEQWRRAGVRVELEPLEFPAYVERRNARNFDIDLTGVNQDPNPAGLLQGWSCAGGNNLAGYCDPGVDSLLNRAESARDGGRELWQAALRRIDAGSPAAFLFSTANVIAVHRRYRDVTLRGDGLWSALAAWSVTAGAELPRDRPGAP